MTWAKVGGDQSLSKEKWKSREGGKMCKTKEGGVCAVYIYIYIYIYIYVCIYILIQDRNYTLV